MSNVPEYLIRVCEAQRVLTNAITSEELTEAAKNVAYYTAMIEAANDEPLDEKAEQEAALSYFETKKMENLDLYMNFVNDLL